MTRQEPHTASVSGIQVEERQQPDCDTACCGGVMPGRWTRPDPAGDPGRRDYVPDAAQGCSYFPYRRAELLDKLLGEVGYLARKDGFTGPDIQASIGSLGDIRVAGRMANKYRDPSRAGQTCGSAAPCISSQPSVTDAPMLARFLQLKHH